MVFWECAGGKRDFGFGICGQVQDRAQKLEGVVLGRTLDAGDVFKLLHVATAWDLVVGSLRRETVKRDHELYCESKDR